VSSSGAPRPSLEEARAKLRELGYLKGRVERFFFRRALTGPAGLLPPVVAAGAFAAALAQTAAVKVAEPHFAASGRALAILFGHLFLAGLVPSALFGFLLLFAAPRSRAPGRFASGVGFAAVAGVLLLWIVATDRLARGLPAAAILWAPPVFLAALLYGASARAAVLGLAFAKSGTLPQRPRRRTLLAAAGMALSAAVLLVAARGERPRPAAPLPSPRRESVLVVGIDGLSLDRQGDGASGIRTLLERGATGWWDARAGSPAEIWTDLSTGVPASRHGVRALEWVRPFGAPPLRPPLLTSWYFRGAGLAAGAVSRSPVSARERRSLAFWEVAAAAGLPSLAVGWWASGPWPGARVVENREVLARASGGLEADSIAIADFERLRVGRALSTLYLAGPDILRDDRLLRAAAADRIRMFLEPEIERARRGETALVVLAADSHPSPRSVGRMVVFEASAPAKSVRIRPEDVAPSILARSGVPPARDLPGRPALSLFRTGSLETATVESYGEREAPATPPQRESDREYLEKLKSLGYLN